MLFMRNWLGACVLLGGFHSAVLFDGTVDKIIYSSKTRALILKFKYVPTCLSFINAATPMNFQANTLKPLYDKVVN